MSSRAIQGNGSYFDFIYSSTPIPTLLADGSSVVFPKIVADVYSVHADDTEQVSINRISYFAGSHKFRIITTPTTQNNFLIIWDVAISSCNHNQIPTFAIVVEANGIEIISISHSGSRTAGTQSGSCLLSLPTPSKEIGRIDYYLSLVNRSGGDCFYNLKTLYITGIVITSIDS